MTMPLVVAAIVFAVVGYFLGLSVGFNGLPAAIVVGALGSPFGLLWAKVGVRALWIPAAGLLLGVIGVVVVQVLSSPHFFGLDYYLFFSLLTAVGVTLLAGIVLQLAPGIRGRVFKAHRVPR